MKTKEATSFIEVAIQTVQTRLGQGRIQEDFWGVCWLDQINVRIRTLRIRTDSPKQTL